jgi:hypothetical protein
MSQVSWRHCKHRWCGDGSGQPHLPTRPTPRWRLAGGRKPPLRKDRAAEPHNPGVSRPPQGPRLRTRSTRRAPPRGPRRPAGGARPCQWSSRSSAPYRLLLRVEMAKVAAGDRRSGAGPANGPVRWPQETDALWHSCRWVRERLRSGPFTLSGRPERISCSRPPAAPISTRSSWSSPGSNTSCGAPHREPPSTHRDEQANGTASSRQQNEQTTSQAHDMLPPEGAML